MSSQIFNNPLDYEEATSVINEYAWSDETTFHFTGHALDRSDERGICEDYVLEALRNGTVINHRELVNKKGKKTYKYKVSYRTRWGETVVITIVPAQNALTIVTEW